MVLVRKPVPGKARGGRPRAFDTENTDRLSLRLPTATVKTIKHLAVEAEVTPAQLIHAWAQRADFLEAIQQGLDDFKTGKAVSHERALKRLAKW